MNRKKFFRNLLGATAAVTVGKYLPVPKELPSVIPQSPIVAAPGILPGIGGQAFKVFFKKGWFRKHDVLQTTTEQYYVAEEYEDRLVCQNTLDFNKPNLEIHFTSAPTGGDKIVRVCSAMHEEYESDKERQLHRGSR